MGVGGATWDTAGPLEVGSDNTFLIADATESADIFDNVAWWTFTPTANVVGRFTVLPAITDNVGFRLYSGADEASKVLVPSTFEEFTQVSNLSVGVTYHLLVGTFDVVEEPSYQVTYETSPLVVSPWLSTLHDRDDNQLIIGRPDSSSGAPRELQATLNPVGFQTNLDWYAEVVQHSPPGREAQYGVLEDFGGPPISTAVDCLWSHALWGDRGSTGGSWDGVCPPLLTGTATAGSGSGSPSYSLDCLDSDNPFADSGLAEIHLLARALYYLPVRDNLGPRGVFPFPDPVDDGYPEGAVLEWESPVVELVKVEITADLIDRSNPDIGITTALRDKVQPTGGGGSWSPWQKGVPGTWVGTGRPYVQFTDDASGDPEWTEVTDVTSGPTGWDGLSDYFGDSAPDDVAVIGVPVAWGGGGSVANPSSASSDCDIALRFTLRAPRYRWVYESATQAIPPRRIFGRSDAATHGARRVIGGGNTRQGGSRTLGSIL